MSRMLGGRDLSGADSGGVGGGGHFLAVVGMGEMLLMGGILHLAEWAKNGQVLDSKERGGGGGGGGGRWTGRGDCQRRVSAISYQLFLYRGRLAEDDRLKGFVEGRKHSGRRKGPM